MAGSRDTLDRDAEARDVDGALEALTAEELRDFVRGVLPRVPYEARGTLVDALLAQAARSSGGWRPSSPAAGLVREAERFVEATRRAGYADPTDVDRYLREAGRALLAGEDATARAVFEALLPPITRVEVDLQQQELVDEVLTVSVDRVGAQYLLSVYRTTPLDDCIAALEAAMEELEPICMLWEPLSEMEDVSSEPLPELEVFLPRWVEHLERRLADDGDWGNRRESQLREALLRLEGVGGLERLARTTGSPTAARAWCEALEQRAQWEEALRAYETAAQLVDDEPWHGDFLDGAALAAQRLGRRDVPKRLELAWLGAPRLTRLVRWLGAGTPAKATLTKRANRALERCPAGAGRQVGLLQVLTGRMGSAAALLADAPGLGWSYADHPGHVLFPSFASLLAEHGGAALPSTFSARLEELPRPTSGHDSLIHIDDILDAYDAFDSPPRRRLDTPSVAELLSTARPAARMQSAEREAIFDAMRSAAHKRVQGILSNKRRRHYRHAAALVAACVQLAPLVGKAEATSAWLAELRTEHARFSAFRRELEEALGTTPH